MEVTRTIKTRLISFVWGFSEATFFFFVPDIWLSRIVLENKKEAYINIAFTTLGAVLGGSVLYFLALNNFEYIQNFLAFIPGISNTMVEQTGNQVQELGLSESLLIGITSGIPYKIYASWSGHLGAPFITFLLSSALIRTLRFIIVTGLANIVGLFLKGRLSMRKILLMHAFCWAGFYAFYFYKVGF